MARMLLFFTPLLLQSAQASAGEKRLVFTGPSVALADKSFRLPCSKDALHAALGTPDRIERLANDIHVWDGIGIFAYVRPGTDETFSVNVALGDMTKFLKFAPKRPFTGPLTVDGAPVTVKSDIDAVNKAKKGQPFRPDFVRYSFRTEGEGFTYFLNRGTPGGFTEGAPFIEFSLEWTGTK